MTDLLRPGSHRVEGLLDDGAVLAAMLRVEVAWVRALGKAGVVDEDLVTTVAGAAERLVVPGALDVAALATAAEDSGNPVVPLVAALREAIKDPAAAAVVHRGLTSQDVLDTVLVLLARDGLTRVRADLRTMVADLTGLVTEHRTSVMVGRTLTQHAVPITFGLKTAQWLAGVLDARDAVEAVLSALPVQCGGAAGTMALTGEITPDPLAVAELFAAELSLAWPVLPWHTSRTVITRTGDALAETIGVVGRIGGDVALLSRPEIAELHEGRVEGRGGSSTMPHKRNPVLSVLLRSAALQAPGHAAQLHLAAGLYVDERPDGAWHAEWPALRTLLGLAVTATSQAAELLARLDVDADAMRARAVAAAADLLAERDGTDRRDRRGRRSRDEDADPSAYLGSTDAFIDVVLRRAQSTREKQFEEKP